MESQTSNLSPQTFLQKRPRGVSLVEMLVYIGLLVLLLSAVISVVVLIMQSYGGVQNRRQAIVAGEMVMERMTREIRQATTTDATSVFGSSPGDLKLYTTDSSGAATTLEIVDTGSDVQIKEAGGAGVSLLPSGTTATSLQFNKITTAKSVGIKIVLTLQAGSGAQAYSATFYDTVGLRGSY